MVEEQWAQRRNWGEWTCLPGGDFRRWMLRWKKRQRGGLEALQTQCLHQLRDAACNWLQWNAGSPNSHFSHRSCGPNRSEIFFQKASSAPEDTTSACSVPCLISSAPKCLVKMSFCRGQWCCCCLVACDSLWWGIPLWLLQRGPQEEQSKHSWTKCCCLPSLTFLDLVVLYILLVSVG